MVHESCFIQVIIITGFVHLLRLHWIETKGIWLRGITSTIRLCWMISHIRRNCRSTVWQCTSRTIHISQWPSPCHSLAWASVKCNMRITIPDSRSPHTTTPGQRAWSRPVSASRGIPAGRRASRGTRCRASCSTSRRTTSSSPPGGSPAGSGISRCWLGGDGAGRVFDKGSVRSPRRGSIGERRIGGRA